MTTTAARLDTVRTAERGKVWSVFLWVLQIAGAGMFLSAGASKLIGAPAMVQVFDAVGFGQWFRFVTGATEVAGAVLLLIPVLAGIGALLLAAVMVGAVLTHLLLVGGSAVPALVLLLAMSTIAIVRRRETLALLERIRD